MTDSLRVLLYGEHAADLTRDGQRLTIRYADTYAARSGATPISLSMPTSVREHTTKTVEPWLWGLLPDSEQVLQRWAREFHVSARNVFALLSHVGEDCAGAVQFVRESRIAALSEEHIEWLTENDVADILRELTADPTSWHQKNLTGQFSLAGAQPKTALHFDGSRWGRPYGNTPTTHILKPTVVGLADHDLNEHLCLRAANAIGLRAAASSIGSFCDQRAVVVRRYDRTALADGQITRIHQEDLCQALSVHPDSKYQFDRGPSPKDIADLFWRDAPRSAAANLAMQFAEALAFNWLIAGTDAHAKNYSLLLLGKDVRLAPLYDIASALPYPELDRHDLRLAMKIGKTYELAYIGRSNWEQLAAQLGLRPAAVLERVEELAARMPDAMAAACSEPDLRQLQSDMPEALLQTVSLRAAACIERLALISASAGTVDTMAHRAVREKPAPTAGVWTAEAAERLIAELSPTQKHLVQALTAQGGQLTPEQAREASGRLPGASLRGLTGPITKAVNRLQRRGVITDDVRSPVETVYEGRVKAARFLLRPEASEAFRVQTATSLSTAPMSEPSGP